MTSENETVLFEAKVNSVYKGSTSFAYFYITTKRIILTKLSTWNVMSHIGDSLLGRLDGDKKPLCEFELSKLISVSRTRFRLNGKCCLFRFEDDEIIIALDSPAKTLEQIRPLLHCDNVSF